MTRKKWQDMTPLEKEQRSLETINDKYYPIQSGDRVWADLSQFFETDAGCLAHKAECVVVETSIGKDWDDSFVRVWCYDKCGTYNIPSKLVTLRFKAVYQMPAEQQKE